MFMNKSKTIPFKNKYIRPEVRKIFIDNTISLVMMTTTPGNPPGPRGDSSKESEPFASPFGDKPFG